MDDNAIDPESVRWWAWTITVFAGLTMVSNLKYYGFKTINLRRSVPFVVIFLIVLFFVLVSYQPPVVLFAGFVLYGLSGYVWSAWLALKRRRG
jgi:CDP-diacylglycerol--serine O-phosphatidyltransferase